MNETMLRQTEALPELKNSLAAMKCRYQGGIREVLTNLEILNDDFSMRYQRNLIHHTESRVKAPESIIEKLLRKGLPLTAESAAQNLGDLAGVRVVCSYISDIYTVAELLTGQDNITLIRWRDYIKEPKENGYRSLHLLVQVPVFLTGGVEHLVVEVQLRTLAMDIWASLEHHIRYKVSAHLPESLNDELAAVAERIVAIDAEIQAIHDKAQTLKDNADKPL